MSNGQHAPKKNTEEFNVNDIHETFLESDWLRAVQGFVHTVQKRADIMQKEGLKKNANFSENGKL